MWQFEQNKVPPKLSTSFHYSTAKHFIIVTDYVKKSLKSLKNIFCHIIGFNNCSLKLSNLDHFEGIQQYLYSSRFWPTVVKRATNNQAYQRLYQHCMCLIAQPVQRMVGRGIAQKNVGCLMELFPLRIECFIQHDRLLVAWWRKTLRPGDFLELF
jgi:hypothetical protein